MSDEQAEVQLPMPEWEFLDKRGPLPVSPNEARRFQRLYFRTRATMRVLPTIPAFQCVEHAAGVYTRDVSRVGIGFLSPEQLFPNEQVVMKVAQLGEMLVTVATCRYVGPKCYSVGATFVKMNDDDAAATSDLPSATA
jgi:hypothetical protein